LPSDRGSPPVSLRSKESGEDGADSLEWLADLDSRALDVRPGWLPMMPSSSKKGTSVPGRLLVLVPFLVMVSACSRTEHAKNARQPDDGRTAAASGAAPVTTHFLRVEDLPVAPPVAVRPLRGRELTPDLVRRARDVLRHEEAPFGTQVVVEKGDKVYIARFEWHYHDELATEGPRGWHKGVTLYATE
jgi:hypothetical protein